MSSEPSPATTYNILFVCSGNTCRSPMAEAIARREIGRRGWTHVAVRSAGSGALTGMPASGGALEVARDVGLDLSAHRSSALGRELVEWADLVLTMTPAHMRRVEELGGEGKTHLLKGFAEGTDSRVASVSDPFGGDVNVYRETCRELDGLIRKALDRLEPILSP